MKEVVFLNKNAQKWRTFEAILNKRRSATADELADLFIQITDDLAFARTYYPTSQISRYLNSLAAKAHQSIYRNKREKNNRLKHYWKYEFPLLLHKYRKNIIYSFIIFIAAVFIGIVSTANDDTFVRIILGDSYVNMTLHNIEQGDPMAVYKKMNEADMFLGITVNNIRVSFIAFIFGLFLSVGTGYILFVNGVMLGCFQYFFYQKGLFWDSFLTIWIHGTLEIWAIIVAGAAGLILGNGILFTKNYPRVYSFQKGAKEGIKIIAGLVPFFITAGFLEGFVTRYTEMPDILRLLIILTSLSIIVWYFFIYPNQLIKKVKTNIYSRSPV